MSDSLYVLGVDPGETTGLAVLRWSGAETWELLDRLEVRGTAEMWEDSLVDLYHELERVIQETCNPGDHEIAAIAMEELLVSGIHSRKERPEAQGIIRLVARLRGIPLRTYAPSTIRSCICGTGRADDAGVKATIRFLLGIQRAKRGEALSSHQVDAIAVALTELRLGQGMPILYPAAKQAVA
jgi:Holliday junction resolvasome RuvABC endonuclease subunit